MKTALISGANGGFGRSIASSLLSEGWRVYAGMRTPVITTSNGLIQPVALDMCDDQQLSDVVKLVESREGRLDALIHCAGIDLAGSFEDLSDTTWREVMEVNFFGAVSLTRYALPLMRRQSRSVIVVVSSLSGLVGLPGNSAYAASKFALEGAFESLRYEVARFGIEVALLEPGAYRTEMAARYERALGQVKETPYTPMVDACIAARADTDKGADPVELGTQVLDMLNNGVKQLHNPVGVQAHSVVAKMRGMDESQRANLIIQASGLDWWMQLEPK
jgi:NAD(P)-dependent dehydrogenase (short-subunit alcohol dehydrogenase family)